MIIKTAIPNWGIWIGLAGAFLIAGAIGLASGAYFKIGLGILGMMVGGIIGAIAFKLFIWILASANPAVTII